jgi:hypothetical protein
VQDIHPICTSDSLYDFPSDANSLFIIIPYSSRTWNCKHIQFIWKHQISGNTFIVLSQQGNNKSEGKMDGKSGATKLSILLDFHVGQRIWSPSDLHEIVGGNRMQKRTCRRPLKREVVTGHKYLQSTNLVTSDTQRSLPHLFSSTLSSASTTSSIRISQLPLMIRHAGSTSLT